MENHQKIIDSKFIPEHGSHTEIIDGEEYLIANDAMYTFYRRTKGEFSRFFLALKEEKKILGCKCSKCGLVRYRLFSHTARTVISRPRIWLKSNKSAK